jgi:type I restriction enzyme S subunit
LSLVDVKDVSIIRPPRHEQDAIVAQLDAAMTQLTGIAATVNTAINRIREYRSALISAAVTGKIDVRNCGEAPPCQ